MGGKETTVCVVSSLPFAVVLAIQVNPMQTKRQGWDASAFFL